MSGRLSRQRMDIERLVNWALEDQGLGWAGRETLHQDFSDYGTVIDDDPSGSHPTISLLSDDDALIVKAGIDGLPIEARALVVQYGRTGLRPEGVHEQIGEPEQMRNKRGQLMWEYAIPGNRRSARRPLLDHLGFSNRRETILFDRAQWTLWREGLFALVAPLNNRLETHYATGPEAPERPWDMPAPVVHGLGTTADAAPAVAVTGSDAYRRAMASVSVEQLRAEAQDPVRARASDWSLPERGVPIRRTEG